MTLDEAIQHCLVKEEANKKMAKDKKEAYYKGIMPTYVEQDYNECIQCAAEHHQLAEWLTELKERRMADDNTQAKERYHIDDYIGRQVYVRLKDGRAYQGELTCDSRYLHIADYITGAPYTFYGKDIEKLITIDIDGE